MSRLAHWSAIAAALLAIVLGVYDAFAPAASGPREPRWAALLTPLAEAPIPAGARVALLAAVGPAGAASDRLLFEAAWQRPDVRWTHAGSGDDSPIELMITVGDRRPSVGWRLVWTDGNVALWRPSP